MASRQNKPSYPALFEAGFKEIQLIEIESIFLGINVTPRRKMLASQLRLFIHKLQELGVKGEIWINGSFSTRNPTPMDYDVLLVMPKIILSAMSEDNLGELDALSSERELTRAKWSCDFYVIESSNIGDRKYYEELFSKNPDLQNRKGIPVIKL